MQAANEHPAEPNHLLDTAQVTYTGVATSDCDRIMALADSTQERMDEVLFSSVVEVCIRIGRSVAAASTSQAYRDSEQALELLLR